jgi:hypothetical protein
MRHVAGSAKRVLLDVRHRRRDLLDNRVEEGRALIAAREEQWLLERRRPSQVDSHDAR